MSEQESEKPNQLGKLRREQVKRGDYKESKETFKEINELQNMIK